MIGVVQETKIFEFRDEADLARALSWYGSKYDVEIIVITDTLSKIKGIIFNDKFLFPANLIDGQKYRIFGTNLKEVKEMSKNDIMPVSYSYKPDGVSFIFGEQRVPKEINF